MRRQPIGCLAPPLGRVLDIGCATGANATLLRERGATELVGIELDHDFAVAARSEYDEVLEASVEGELPWPPGSFDTVLCYDVLEHLYDPWSVVRRLRLLLGPGARLHASVPNIRHRSVLLPLIFKGTFRYQPAGLLDVGHIRFFTLMEAIGLFEHGGYDVRDVSHSTPVTRKGRLIEAITRGRLAGFNAPQWFVLATPRPDIGT